MKKPILMLKTKKGPKLVLCLLLLALACFSVLKSLPDSVPAFAQGSDAGGSNGLFGLINSLV